MFSWNIAKSAEAMFSRWAIKRLCKFLLKKKLGKIILGDVDLKQLDVQLSAGTVKLTDLALNVDYLNHKFGAAAAVMVKEGSIGSLLLTLPWSGDGCRIEVDELELIIAPGGASVLHDGSETRNFGQNNNHPANHDSRKLENDSGSSGGVTLTSVYVHEGVKTVAKMVKWLLSSFHVKIKRLIVAFDPCIVEETNKRFSRNLVLRISEAECGTCISEDPDPHLMEEAKDNFLGLSRLTNFFKFQGAVLELLQIDDVEHQSTCACASGINFGEWFSDRCQSTAMTPIITGQNGGFSGHLKLSIPWKNGSLDIRKVDVDAYIEPLELRFQPSTIAWFICLWDMFKDMGSTSGSEMLCKATDTVYDNAALNYTSSMPDVRSLNADKVLEENDNSLANCSSLLEEECQLEALLSESHLISDWVGRSQKDEPDFGESVYQFFECFDELRSSQSALGQSGMWNWTCSVFSAITAVSNLASGSLPSAPVQQHVETNLKVTVARISILFSFFDKKPEYSCYERENQAKAAQYVHYLDMKFLDLLLVLQVCPEEMNFEATVQHIELDDHFSSENDKIDPKLQNESVTASSLTDLIQAMQDAVQDALIPFSSSGEYAGMVSRRGFDVDVQPSMVASNACSCITSCECIDMDNVVKVALFKTSGISRCQVTVSTGTSANFVLGPVSFTLSLPPCVLWANFGLVDKVSDLLKEVGACKMSHGRNNFASKTIFSEKELYSQENEEKNSHGRVSSIPSDESLRGNICLSNARIILMAGYYSFNQFLALDFSYPQKFGDKNPKASEPASGTSLSKGGLLENSKSLQLSWKDLAVYLITSDPGENGGIELSNVLKWKLSAHMIMSIANETSQLSAISMFWQDGTTGPWITRRAKLLATSGNLKNRQRFTGKDYEFASVTTAKDMEESDNRAKQEMVLSSGFFIHVLLSPVMVNLGKAHYDSLICLLHQLVNCLSCMASDTLKEESSISQTSILVDCDSVGIAVCMEEKVDTKSSTQSELPGSWHGFRLKIQKFELLSVSNIGRVRGAKFVWMSHGEGSLSGFVTGVPHEELLLISCSNSTMGRGDGEGSNVLTPRFAGSDIVHLWNPDELHSYMSIAVRCGTIVAIGGRVDWWEAISSFFSVPCREIEQTGENSLQEGGSESSAPFQTSFILNLVDIGVNYEPNMYPCASTDGLDVESSSGMVSKAADDQYIACLLAASSFTLSSNSISDSSVGVYNIRLQDLGLLLCPVSGPKTSGSNYSVEHLSRAGYVKVAHVAHVKALLKTYSKGYPRWEVESSDLRIVVGTCSDTACGLIRLGAQLQQLFAPNLEDTLVHLQTRWNDVQGTTEDAQIGTHLGDAALSDIEGQNLGANSSSCRSNLMDEICEDAFQLVGNADGQRDYDDREFNMSINDNVLGEPSELSASNGEHFAGCFSFSESNPVVGLENNGASFQDENVPEFIEEYFLSDLRPLSGVSFTSQLPNELHCKAGITGSGELPYRNNGWYGNTSLRIVENHVSEVNDQANPGQLENSESSSGCTELDDHGRIKGCILLKNMNIVWRLYAGSDWSNFQKSQEHSTSGRDATVCLEISLSRMQIQYDIFPDGGLHASLLSLAIQYFRVNDNSKNAPWKLVLGYYQSKDHPRKSSSKALKMDLESVRPDPSTPLEEYRLRVAFLPMRLHLHQSQLDFLINFFGGQRTSINSSKNGTHDILEAGKGSHKAASLSGHTIVQEALLPFFQKFDIWPVLIRVDYVPSHFDLAALRSGKYVELVNLLTWKGVELQLKHVHSVGVYGWSSVGEMVLGEWLEDISQNQVHKLLKGLPPIRSLVAVGSGATKLVTLPVNGYRKDRRLLKGVQRGTIAFLRSISLEAIGLGVHLAAGAHDILLQAEYILTTIPPSVSCPLQSRANTSVRSNQPEDARQGIKQAYHSISDGLGKSASALVRTPLKKYQRGDGVGSALAAVVQATPVAAVAPASAAARAMHYALLGVRNSLDPEHKKESLDKYLGSSQQREFM
ncbi:autophagy-related protein 2 [Coffea eugenioides]|uniref:autophagy-related protein 2 n=1 Tax=Coffea eugenioides TaxID=49369 RepID=UPI000F60EFA9|nr:autophagy-related protein 2 [Coffea eugenioides]